MADDKYKGNIAAEAWAKTKDANDSEFDAIPNVEFRQQLQFRADKVRETGIAITNFEKEVANILANQPKDDAPMAVVEPPPGVNYEAAAEGKVEKESANASEDEDYTPSETEVNALVKANNRDKLNKMAKKAGLDGNSYTSKPELARAILQSKPKGSKAGAPKGDQSGHVPSAEEAASIIREEANAPLHP